MVFKLSLGFNYFKWLSIKFLILDHNIVVNRSYTSPHNSFPHHSCPHKPSPHNSSPHNPFPHNLSPHKLSIQYFWHIYVHIFFLNIE